MSAKARRRLEALADGDVEERVFSVFPELRELMRRQGMARIADRLYAIDRGEIIFEGKPQQALEDENVMKALRG